jgi:hypothetical protein
VALDKNFHAAPNQVFEEKFTIQYVEEDHFKVQKNTPPLGTDLKTTLSPIF